jgi:hypothetical protein
MALALAIIWTIGVGLVTFAILVESWAALWRRLDRLAVTRRRWWGPR